MMFSRKALLAGAATLFVLSAISFFRQPQRIAAIRVESLFNQEAPPTATSSPANTTHNTATSQPTPLAVPGAVWQQNSDDPQQTAFQAWVRRFSEANPAERNALETEGLGLARARLNLLTDLMQHDPERALLMAVPSAVKQSLPAAVREFIEEQVSARGDYEVLCVYPTDAGAARNQALIRTAIIAGETHLVYTFGKGLEYTTHRQVPLQGITVPLATIQQPPEGATPNGVAASKLMVLDPNPARLLEESERAAYAAAQSTEPRCTITGEPWTVNQQPVALQFAGDIFPFSSPILAARWAETNATTAYLDPPTAASSYTEGRKRFMLFRVDFPDYAGEVMSTNQALTLMSGMSNFMAELSYGKLSVAPVGQGSDITPTMRLPNAVESYQDMGTLLSACRTAAAALGYDMNQYDFYFVCTAGKPTVSFAGLGYVGGVGFWLGNGYWDVRTGAHEFGHNLGLGHANWWDTGGQSMIGAGTSEEYGDVFDTMGINGGGNYHYSSYSKNKLGWIPNADCPTVNASSGFRLYAHDDIRGSGVRGLRLKRAAGDYWVEFRQKFTTKKAMMNGLGLRWVGGSTTLVDCNPGSSAGKDDHPLTIGRTFSDTKLGIHVTPVGKANTYPEALDVVVNLGTFPANHPPEVTATASTLAASANQTISFAATGADADGDTLAYFWDFGDGDYSTDNRPVVSHSFASAGEYYVHCTASDMKGGTAGDALVVRVGAPTTFRISGRVLTTNSLPVRAVKVSVDASHYAFTRSDGTFDLTRLNAGSYTVNIGEPVYDEANFVNPYFNNPVAVGPNFATADFVQFPGQLNIYTPLIAKGATWKYLDNGSNQGTAWIPAGFNDSGWSNGAAVLGYGQGNETTVIRYGADSANKHITYYFRKSFTVPNPAAYTNLALEVLRDDGLIVYLNSQEIFRDNMPAGAVTYLTHASQPVEPDNYLRTNLPISVLLTGSNQLAIEVHQVEPTSSDINFDLALSGLSITNAGGLNLVYLSGPNTGDRFIAPANIPLAAVAHSGGSAVTQVRFYADGAPLTADGTAPYTATNLNPTIGQHVFQAVAVLQSGTMLTSAPVVIEVVEPTPTPPPPVQLSLISTGAFWRFFTSPTGAPPAWAEATFVDASWTNGQAQLGYGENDERAKLSYGPDINNKWITAYFRHPFVVNDPYTITNLTMLLKRDDGAIVYLNGQEILRDLMPLGPVIYSTLATNAPDDGANFNPFNFAALDLRPGTNLLAVEIHQSATNSSDLSFDLSLTALASTNRSRGVWVTSPAASAQLSAGSPLALASEPVAGGSLGVATVSYFANGQLVGEATYPFGFSWANPLVGAVQLIAVATDTAGGTITSAPVNVTVTAPSPGRALVSFGEVWKYLDDGSDQATNWTRLTYDDRAWKAGAARLGYGGDGERTQISDGGDPNFRHITAYFRKSFVATPGGLNRLLLRLICDDGAVVYLNGREVYRYNLNAGLVSFNSLATITVSGAGETTPMEIELPATNLVSGTNLLAVEIHQVNITSSDTGFDLQLTGLAATTGGVVYLTAPAYGARFNLPASIAFSAFAFTDGDAASRVEYFAGATKIGEATAYPYAVTWANAAAGSYLVAARASFPSGLVVTSAPVAFVLVAPPPVIQPISELLIADASNWRFWDNVAAVGTGWSLTSFNDAAWPSGQARFGWGFDGEKTELTSGRITHYFRKWFVATNPALFTELSFQLARDDGAVVYLNGREVFRSNMPGGAVTASTLASTTVNTPDETTFFETIIPVAGAGLVAGSNLVAVELHQGSATSSDAGFDLRLLGYGTTEPRIYFVSPAAGQQFTYGQPIALEAFVWAGSGVSAGAVEFLADSLIIGASPAGNSQFTWTNASLGNHLLTVRVADSGLESPPVNLAVVYQPISLSLIATGAVWKYWDRGTLPAANWMTRGYNDGAWSNGMARLGYGGDGERTTNSYGGNANNKYITTYFRTWYSIPAGVTITNLFFHLLRDDGAVVYLNGAEVFRSNMPIGLVNNTTTASAAVSGADEQTYFTTRLPVAGLLPGTNLIAVEIHQSSATSSDLGFDLEVLGEGFTGHETPAAVSAPMSAYTGLQIAWPTNMYGWALYSTTNLASGSAWSKVTGGIGITNGVYLHVVAPNSRAAFYRLELR